MKFYQYPLLSLQLFKESRYQQGRDGSIIESVTRSSYVNWLNNDNSIKNYVLKR